MHKCNRRNVSGWTVVLTDDEGAFAQHSAEVDVAAAIKAVVAEMRLGRGLDAGDDGGTRVDHVMRGNVTQYACGIGPDGEELGLDDHEAMAEHNFLPSPIPSPIPSHYGDLVTAINNRK